MLKIEKPQGISRRTLLKGIGVGTAAAVLGGSVLRPSGASAQSNPTLAREAAFYRLRVGTFDVTVINDGLVNLPAPVLGVNTPEGTVAAFLEENYLPADVFVAPAHVMLVDTGDQRVLIDTGLGDIALPGSTPNSGKLLPTLALLGIDPGEIGTVILTHAHPDHIGGVAQPDGRVTFPNATHYLAQADFDFWTGLPTDSADDFANFFASVAQTKLPAIEGQIEPLTGETEIAPGIIAFPTPGHTPGHYAVLLRSENEQVFNIGDVALHHLIGLEHPGWHLGLEVDPVTAEATRRELLLRASEERAKVFGYHFPFPGIGYAIRHEANDRWEYVVTG